MSWTFKSRLVEEAPKVQRMLPEIFYDANDATNHVADKAERHQGLVGVKVHEVDRSRLTEADQSALAAADRVFWDLSNRLSSWKLVILQRVMDEAEAKGQLTIPCKCGSTLAVERLRKMKTIHCPLCYQDFATTEQDVTAEAELREAIATAKREVTAIKAKAVAAYPCSTQKWVIGFLDLDRPDDDGWD